MKPGQNKLQVNCRMVALQGWFLLASNLALADEQTAPAQPAVSMRANPVTASRRNQGLDLSRLNRRHAEMTESELFSTKSLFPQPAVDAVPLEPAAPPLPFVFLGRIRQDGTETVFLSNDKQSYAAKLKDTLDGAYLVSRIEEDKIEFVYLPLNAKQILNIPHGE